jgi:hypothetical protein
MDPSTEHKKIESDKSSEKPDPIDKFTEPYNPFPGLKQLKGAFKPSKKQAPKSKSK